jgi:hypothetical protein
MRNSRRSRSSLLHLHCHPICRCSLANYSNFMLHLHVLAHILAAFVLYASPVARSGRARTLSSLAAR